MIKKTPGRQGHIQLIPRMNDAALAEIGMDLLFQRKGTHDPGERHQIFFKPVCTGIGNIIGNGVVSIFLNQ